jgi:L-fuconolactonase
MIDAHHHFWIYRAEEFGWMTDEMAVLRQDFLPQHLEPLLTANGITGVITVQAK